MTNIIKDLHAIINAGDNYFILVIYTSPFFCYLIHCFITKSVFLPIYNACKWSQHGTFRLLIVVKTEDIHPPKTGISVHFCVLSLMAMQK